MRLLSLLIFIPFLPLCPALVCWRNTSCDGPLAPAFTGPWESYILAPNSRWVEPRSIFTLTNTTASPYPGSITLTRGQSLYVLDFGFEVGGVVHLDWSTNDTGQLGLAFSEAKNWIGEFSDNSHAGDPDGAIYAPLSNGTGTYVMPDNLLRGGLRYLSLFLPGNGSVTISNLTLEMSFQPTWPNLKAYQGYFHSDDELLNRIWYAGAYTLQASIIPSNAGGGIDAAPPEYPWNYIGIAANGSSVLVDGAKRDRLVWPGDMGIELPSLYLSLGPASGVREALNTIYDHQNIDGSFPQAGPPYLAQDSDTYHMWTMIATYYYILYTDDMDWLSQYWAGYIKAMEFIYAKVAADGLLNVTGTNDWARLTQGGKNSEANMILYHTLTTGVTLARWIDNDSQFIGTWLDYSSALREAINLYCWDTSFGAFKDDAGPSTLYPQDANSMAIAYNVVSPTSNASRCISEYLHTNWNELGPVSPELPHNIVPFISSIELQAHFTSGHTLRGLDLIRRTWGWYLNNPNGTQSTLIEGFKDDGSFAYRYNKGYKDTSYTSHAHGWSTGPTSTLTEYVLGLRVTERLGRSWRLSPQFGDLTHVEGGFVTALGRFRASWEVTPRGYEIRVDTPAKTRGEILLPVLPGLENRVQLDQRRVEHAIGDGVLKVQVAGGSHLVKVS
ncbi:uncharacterized protein APUU_20295S [Aspergillus puulaauensis]|uniref:Uncharacterized protein n=1 Tax=Aspergillus puulaauensis TaxID=1220207 RepID=A0A7R7XF28_9EURO|nr:uncharacterized protein APUU_20295S [Aspergillus puulaauensis]BCS19863.1 hypothetical protein APUU_20295S [Aspergillus puulaauensis]